jgi:hypothetical protein
MVCCAHFVDALLCTAHLADRIMIGNCNHAITIPLPSRGGAEQPLRDKDKE